MCTNKLNNQKRRDAAMVIIKRLKGLGYSQREIALAAMLDESHISRIVKGFQGITRGTLRCIEGAEPDLLNRYAKKQKKSKKSG